MLSPYDLALAGRDPDLPGLATLLDPEALMYALRAACPEVPLQNLKPCYVRYKPGTNCVVAYETDVAGEPVTLYGKAHGADATTKLQKARQTRAVPGALGPGRIVLPDHAIVVSVFPNDRKLKRLSRLAEVDCRAAFLATLFPEQPEVGAGTLRRLRYKPERRYVAQLVVQEKPAAVLRFYTPTRYRVAKHCTGTLTSCGSLRLARQLGASDSYRCIAVEWLLGRPLDAMLFNGDVSVDVMARIGAALAVLHSQDSAGLLHRKRAEEAAGIHQIAASVHILHPSLAVQTDRIATQIATRLAALEPVARPIHGDFYAEQVVLCDDGEAVGLIDLDRVVCGDPAADLGQFIAHLERAALQGNLPATQAEALGAALLEGYRRAGATVTDERVTLYVAASLWQLAPEPFRYRAVDWPSQVEAIVARTGTYLQHLPPTPNRRHVTRKERVPVQVAGANTTVPDPSMPTLTSALDPRIAEAHLNRCMQRKEGARLRLRAIRLTRHKPGRRCLIEYDVELQKPYAPPERATLIGKVRTKGPDTATYRLIQRLWENGFDDRSQDGISVPEPMGIVPQLHMWLQRKVPGDVATQLLPESGGIILAERVADVAYKLHRANISPRTRHTMADELRILHERLLVVAEMKPEWSDRLTQLLEACVRLANVTPTPYRCGIHRDLYADQVLVDGERLYLLDLDNYCEGDPGLDVGNFIGHVTEQSLRDFGDATALSDREAAVAERFARLAGEAIRPSIQSYATLTLVRHIFLSMQFPDRHHTTEALLELCERRLTTK